MICYRPALVTTSTVNEFWMDARYLMNELANLRGATLIMSAPRNADFVVIANDDLIDCERAVGDREILDSRICS